MKPRIGFEEANNHQLENLITFYGIIFGLIIVLAGLAIACAMMFSKRSKIHEGNVISHGLYPGWTRTGGKQGGTKVKDSPEQGMFNHYDGRKALFKCDDTGSETVIANNIAEYITSVLFKRFCQAMGLPRLSVHYEWVVSQDEVHVALASIYETDHFKEVGTRRGAMSKWNEHSKTVKVFDKLIQQGVKHYEPMIGLSILFGDFSIHRANIGYGGSPGNQRFIRFDFGAAFRGKAFRDQVDIGITIPSRRYQNVDKNYLRKHHDAKRIHSPEMTTTLRQIENTPFDFKKEFTAAWEHVKVAHEAGSQYDIALKAFRRRVGMKSSDGTSEQEMIDFVSNRWSIGRGAWSRDFGSEGRVELTGL